jgi:hypothetical protein
MKTKTVVQTKPESKYAPEKIPVRFIGTLRNKHGTKYHVYSTASKEQILMSPVTPSGRETNIKIPVKIADLSLKLRRRLGC